MPPTGRLSGPFNPYTNIFDAIGGREVERLKTRGSARWAAVGGEWAERLLALQDEARGRGDAWLTDDGLGGPVGQRAARAAWVRAVAATGPPPVLLKNLRATFATQMDARDVPVEQIARLMRHTTPNIMFDVHERPGMDRAAQIAARAAGSEGVGTIWDAGVSDGPCTRGFCRAAYNTVKYHVRNVYAKMGVHSQQDLINLLCVSDLDARHA